MLDWTNTFLAQQDSQCDLVWLLNLPVTGSGSSHQVKWLFLYTWLSGTVPGSACSRPPPFPRSGISLKNRQNAELCHTEERFWNRSVFGANSRCWMFFRNFSRVWRFSGIDNLSKCHIAPVELRNTPQDNPALEWWIRYISVLRIWLQNLPYISVPWIAIL